MADVIDKIQEFRRQERPFLAVGVIAAAVCSAVWLPAWISAAWLAANLISASAGQWVIERRFAHARRGWSEWELAAWTMISAIFYALLPLLLVIQRDQMATLTAVCIAGSLLLRGANEFSISKLTGGAILSSMFIIATFGAIFQMFDAPILQIGAVLVTLSAFFAYILDHAQHRRDGERRLADALAAAERNERRANAASEAKSTFLATMSHEIRTPLNGILGMAQAMRADATAPDQIERLEVIQASGSALLAVLNDVLDLAKIEAGRLECVTETFDPGELAGQVANSFSSLAEAKGVTLSLKIKPGAAGLYQGDPVRLRQVLSNLVSNAVKFTDQGAIQLEVSRAGDRHRFVVTDTGVGVVAEQIPHLFEKFSQVDSSTTRRHGGTGLGLSISAALCALMNGQIDVESQPGQGSRFTVTLPLTPYSGVTPVVETRSKGRELKGLRLLAAEDHAVNQIVLRSLLSQFGIDAVIVANGEEAVDAWRRETWDLVLMDVQMPVLDGVEATRTIRALELEEGRSRVPILALTANTMSHHLEAYAAAGMNGCVSKPIDAEALLDALVSALAPEPSI